MPRKPSSKRTVRSAWQAPKTSSETQNSRRAYLGPAETALLARYSLSVRVALHEEGRRETTIPLHKMFYVAAFQGGVERFLTTLIEGRAVEENGTFVEVKPKEEGVDLFLRTRMSDAKWDSEPGLALLKVMLRDHGVEGFATLMFVHDLLMGMHNKAAVINVSGIPTVQQVQRFLPPDLAHPICAIVSGFRTTNESLPAPAHFAVQDPLDRFKELLMSGVFDHYATAHKRVEYEFHRSVLADIRKKGVELLKAGKGVLANRRVSLSVLQIVPKIVDAAFGKLPGSLARSAGDLAATYLGQRRNIVVYQFGAWANEYAKAVSGRQVPLSEKVTASVVTVTVKPT